MNSEMIVSIVLGVISMVNGWGWVTNRRKYKQEVKNLEAETRQRYMDLAKMYVDEFTKNIVKPLEVRVEDLTNEVNRLKDAIEKVNDCPYRDRCPVRNNGMPRDEGGDEV